MGNPENSRREPGPWVKRSPWIISVLILALGAWGLSLFYRNLNATPFDGESLGLAVTPDMGSWADEFREEFQVLYSDLDDDRTREESLGKLAMLLHANGYFSEARSYYRVLIDLNPEEAKWWYFLADTIQDYSELPKVVEYLNTVASLRPGYSNAYLKLGNVHFKLGDYEKAKVGYEKRISMEPDDPYGWLGLARCHIEGEAWKEAEHCLRRAIEAKVEFSTPYTLMARVCQELGDSEKRNWASAQAKLHSRFRDADDPWLRELTSLCYDTYRLQVLAAIEVQTYHEEAAIPLLKRSLSIDPKDGDALIALGRIYLGKKEFAEAKEYFLKAYRFAPRNEYAYSELCSVLIELKDFEGALKIALRGVEVIPMSAALYNQLGVAYEKTNNAVSAETAYRKAIKFDSVNQPAIRNLGVLLFETQGPEKLKWLERLIELKPDDIDIRTRLGEFYLRSGNFEKAIGHLLAARRYAREDLDQIDHFISIAYLRLGSAQAKGGDVDAAISSYERSLSFDAENAAVFSNLGAMYGAKRDFEASILNFRKFLEMEPNVPLGYVNLGKALWVKEDFGGAEDAFSRAIVLYGRQGDQEGEARVRTLMNQMLLGLE